MIGIPFFMGVLEDSFPEGMGKDKRAIQTRERCHEVDRLTIVILKFKASRLTNSLPL